MIIYQSQIDAAKLRTSPIDGSQYKVILASNGVTVKISFEYCRNRNHAHEAAGPCNMSSWAARHTCWYCGANLGNVEGYPCVHYKRSE